MLSLINIILILFGITDTLESDLNNYLSEKLKGYSKYSYEVLSTPSKSAEHKIRLDNTRDFRLNNGYMYVPVHIQPKNSRSTNGYVTLKLNLFKEVFVSLNDIERGTELAETDFIKVEKEVTELRFEAVDRKDEFINNRAKVRIPKGQVLSKNAVEKIPIIQIGDMITGYVKKGSVIISLDVKAKQDGYKNKIIRVLSDDNRIYRARVESSSRVLIIE